MARRGQKTGATYTPTHSYKTQYRMRSNTGRSTAARVQDGIVNATATVTYSISAYIARLEQPEQTRHIAETPTRAAKSTGES